MKPWQPQVGQTLPPSLASLPPAPWWDSRSAARPDKMPFASEGLWHRPVDEPVIKPGQTCEEPDLLPNPFSAGFLAEAQHVQGWNKEIVGYETGLARPHPPELPLNPEMGRQELRQVMAPCVPQGLVAECLANTVRYFGERSRLTGVRLPAFTRTRRKSR